MIDEPTKWMQQQTNPLQTPEDKLKWTVERLTWIKNVTVLSRGDNSTLDAVLDEVDSLLSEIQSGRMADRKIVD